MIREHRRFFVWLTQECMYLEVLMRSPMFAESLSPDGTVMPAFACDSASRQDPERRFQAGRSVRLDPTHSFRSKVITGHI